MDIKNALNAILPLNLRHKEGADRTIKMGSTTDRDANGQQAYSQNQNQHGPMSDEQFQKAIEILKNMPAIKEHSLSIEELIENDRRFVLIKEPSGKVVRRIPEAELWGLQEMKSSDPNKKGQLLRKTA